MKVTLSIVPPAGGEQGFALEMDLPAIPKVNDYVSVRSLNEQGQANYIVRRTWWYLGYSETTKIGSPEGIVVECEVAIGPHQSESHQRLCEAYRASGKEPREFQASTF